MSTTMKSEFAIPAVGALIFNTEGKVFLVKSSGKFGVEWIVPGGKVTFGEKLIDALTREIYEETAMKIDGAKLLGAREFLSESKHFIFLECAAWIDEPGEIRLNEEATEYGWFKLEELQDLVVAAPTMEFIAERWGQALDVLPERFKH